MGSKIFREKSIERISSPEQLSDYLKVPNVSIWIILLTLFFIAASIIVWSFAGDIMTRIETTGIFTAEINKSLNVSAVVSKDESKNIKLGMPCRVYNRYSDDEECVLGYVTDVARDVTLFDGENYPKKWVNDKIFESGECVLVSIDLVKEPNSSNNYKWQDDKAALDQGFLKRGNLCKVNIITEVIKPIDFLTA